MNVPAGNIQGVKVYWTPCLECCRKHAGRGGTCEGHEMPAFPQPFSPGSIAAQVTEQRMHEIAKEKIQDLLRDLFGWSSGEDPRKRFDMRVQGLAIDQVMNCVALHQVLTDLEARIGKLGGKINDALVGMLAPGSSEASAQAFTARVRWLAKQEQDGNGGKMEAAIAQHARDLALEEAAALFKDGGSYFAAVIKDFIRTLKNKNAGVAQSVERPTLAAAGVGEDAGSTPATGSVPSPQMIRDLEDERDNARANLVREQGRNDRLEKELKLLKGPRKIEILPDGKVLDVLGPVQKELEREKLRAESLAREVQHLRNVIEISAAETNAAVDAERNATLKECADACAARGWTECAEGLRSRIQDRTPAATCDGAENGRPNSEARALAPEQTDRPLSEYAQAAIVFAECDHQWHASPGPEHAMLRDQARRRFAAVRRPTL